ARVKITFAKPVLPKADAIAVGVHAGARFAPTGARLDRATKGALARALKSSRFKGEVGETLSVLAPRGLRNSRVLLVGLGAAAKLGALAAEKIGGAVAAQLAPSGEKTAALALDLTAELAAHVALGARLRGYRFGKYRTTEKADAKPSLKSLAVLVEDPAAARRADAPLTSTAAAVCAVRDLVNEPANVIHP